MNLRSVILYATTDCNHRCAHCFLEHSASWKPRELLRVARLFVRKCQVTINGAETLLYPDYLDAYEAVGQQYVFTNGKVFLNSDGPALMDRMKQQGITTIRLSNHFQATEALQAVPVQTVEELTRLLQQNGFRVEYNSTVTVDNYLHIQDNCRHSQSLGVRRVKFFPLFRTGRATDRHDALTKSQLVSFYQGLQSARDLYRPDILEIRTSGDFAGIVPKFRCEFGHGMYTITPDGKVHGCPYAISVLPPVGQLKENGTIVIEQEVPHDGTACVVNKFLSVRDKP